jgi:tetratricopeptide (TPR) repeat protein
MSNSRYEKLLKMLEEQPSDLFLQYALAMEYIGMQCIHDAESILRSVIQTDEHYVAAYYQLGKILEQSSRDQEAILIYEKGMEEARLKNDRKTMNEFRSALDELLF